MYPGKMSFRALCTMADYFVIINIAWHNHWPVLVCHIVIMSLLLLSLGYLSHVCELGNVSSVIGGLLTPRTWNEFLVFLYYCINAGMQWHLLMH